MDVFIYLSHQIETINQAIKQENKQEKKPTFTLSKELKTNNFLSLGHSLFHERVELPRSPSAAAHVSAAVVVFSLFLDGVAVVTSFCIHIPRMRR